MPRPFNVCACGDHACGTDNRRKNLRFCTSAENIANRRCFSKSGFKGVYPTATKQKWMAQINAAGRRQHLGVYVTPEDAARAYDAAVLRLHGEFARTNFPVGGAR